MREILRQKFIRFLCYNTHMTKRIQPNEIEATLKIFSSRDYEKYGCYSHVAGVYETMLAEAINQLPAKAQAEFMRRISTLTPDPKI